MQTFTGLEYIQIDLANNFGKDKLTWDERLLWFNQNKSILNEIADQADNPFLFRKAINAYNDAINKKPTGFIMALDATASGLQIMSCLSGCKETAKAVNLTNTGQREDVYTFVSNLMNTMLSKTEEVSRKLIKKPLMTHYYNKSRPDGLNEQQEIAFFKVLKNAFSGPEDVMAMVKEVWDPSTLMHKWTLPDGHVARVKVTEKEDKRIEIDELGVTFTYRFDANKPSSLSTSLCPNFIHSLDAWVVREMIRRAKKQRFQLVHIHDSFWASPNYMNHVRQNYVEILAELADSNAFQNFLQELGLDDIVIKDSDDLSVDILKSEYALS